MSPYKRLSLCKQHSVSKFSKLYHTASTFAERIHHVTEVEMSENVSWYTFFVSLLSLKITKFLGESIVMSTKALSFSDF